MEFTKKQHYVPQFYLENFSNEKRKIWVLDKTNNKIFQRSLREICTTSYLYETEWKIPYKGEKYVFLNYIEKVFSKKEGEYASLLKKIEGICNCGKNTEALIMKSEDKQLMAEFVTNMFVRNPSILKIFIKDMKDISNLRVFHPIREATKQFEMDFDSLYEATCKQIITFDKEKKTLPYELKQELLKSNVYIWMTEENACFVTASFPVAYQTRDVDNQTFLESLFMPLTPHIGIFYASEYCDYGRRKKNKINILTKNSVKEINDYYKMVSNEYSRFVLANSKEQLKIG